jgi:site-specific DNA recombinase
MVHTYTTKPNGRHYRYYVCLTAQKRGWHVCSTKSVPAHELEQFVVDQIRAIGRDPALVKACATKAREATKARIDTLKAELDALTRAARKCGNEVRDLAGDVTRAAAMADAQDRLRATERRQKDVTNELEDLKRDLVDDDTVAEALAQFGPVWETLSPREQARLISLMVSRVTYNADAGTVVLTFRTGASEALAAKPEEIAA